ncbi:MAG TPA: hypothetical protein VIC55_08385, partial [Gemmatimonadaceae bacterium]
AATHGRSFWILDDVTPLRQLDTAIADSLGFLFTPAPAYRVRRDQNTDTPLPPEEPAGTNPPDGAIIDYWLGGGAAPAGAVTLEVRDAHGAMVRRFSSADEPPPPDSGLNVPAYWLRPPQVLSARPGMHRFVWDLHYPSPDALQHDYPISAIVHDTPREPLGPDVVPGRYTVRLDVAGRSYTRPLTIKMDPRVHTTSSGLMQQLALATRLTRAMHQDVLALRQARALRLQVAALQERGRVPPGGALADAVRALDTKLAALVGSRRSAGPGVATGEDVDDLARLNGELAGVLGIIDGTDAPPTTQGAAAVPVLERQLSSTLMRWRAIQSTDVPTLNALLRSAQLPELSVGS